MAYILGMRSVPLTVVELPQFLRQAADLWTEAERHEFVDYIARNPEAGDVIPETGGVRKVRWRRQGMGKRGGVRVIYFYHNPTTPLFLLMVYAKAVREDVAPEAKKALGGIGGMPHRAPCADEAREIGDASSSAVIWCRACRKPPPLPKVRRPAHAFMSSKFPTCALFASVCTCRSSASLRPTAFLCRR